MLSTRLRVALPVNISDTMTLSVKLSHWVIMWHVGPLQSHWFVTTVVNRHTSDSTHFKAVVTCKTKHLQKCCEKWFILHVTPSKMFLKCFTLNHLQKCCKTRRKLTACVLLRSVHKSNMQTAVQCLPFHYITCMCLLYYSETQKQQLN